jgi:hypothetical protein
LQRYFFITVRALLPSVHTGPERLNVGAGKELKKIIHGAIFLNDDDDVLDR